MATFMTRLLTKARSHPGASPGAGAPGVKRSTPPQSKRAEAFYRDGRAAEARSEWMRARANYRVCVALEPTNADYALRLASTLDRTGKGGEAKDLALDTVNALMHPKYDAVKAITTHAAYFAERNEMAEFLIAHRDELSRRARAAAAKATPLAGEQPPVFTYWEQGFDHAPDVVAACHASLAAATPAANLHALSSSNLGEYIEVPADVRARVEANRTHMSDVVRMLLLQKYGGLWIDATCFITRPLLEGSAPLRENGFFCFTYAGSRVGTWLMWGATGDYSTSLVCEALLLWWRTEGRLTNYFMHHDIIEMLYWTDEPYRRAWDAAGHEHPRRSLELLGELTKPYDETTARRILGDSFVQKLSYKFDQGALARDSVATAVADGRVGALARW